MNRSAWRKKPPARQPKPRKLNAPVSKLRPRQNVNASKLKPPKPRPRRTPKSLNERDSKRKRQSALLRKLLIRLNRNV